MGTERMLFDIAKTGDVGAAMGFLESEVRRKAIDDMLLLSVRHKKYDLVKFLIQEGADINGLDGHALYIAIEENAADILRLLLKNGGKLTEDMSKMAVEKKEVCLEIFNLINKNA